MLWPTTLCNPYLLMKEILNFSDLMFCSKCHVPTLFFLGTSMYFLFCFLFDFLWVFFLIKDQGILSLVADHKTTVQLLQVLGLLSQDEHPSGTSILKIY